MLVNMKQTESLKRGFALLLFACAKRKWLPYWRDVRNMCRRDTCRELVFPAEAIID